VVHQLSSNHDDKYKIVTHKIEIDIQSVYSVYLSTMGHSLSNATNIANTTNVTSLKMFSRKARDISTNRVPHTEDNPVAVDEIVITTENTDSVVFSIIQKIKSRADVGFKKYKTNLDRTDLSTLDWINHAQEELMDGILYLEKLKQVEMRKEPPLYHLSSMGTNTRCQKMPTDASVPPFHTYPPDDEYFSNFVRPDLAPGTNHGVDLLVPLIDPSNITIAMSEKQI